MLNALELLVRVYGLHWNSLPTIWLIREWLVEILTLLDQHEKRGGAALRLGDMEEFNEAVQKAELMVVEFDRSFFTWANGSIWQRLDRMLVNTQWAATFNMVHVSHLARGRLDHSPPLTKSSPRQHVRGSFRFLNMWVTDLQFNQVVQHSWAQSHEGKGTVGFLSEANGASKRS